MKKIDITNQKFGKLLILEDCGNNRVIAKCDCGITKYFYKHTVKSGGTRSCGECRKPNRDHKLYRVYYNMKNNSTKDFETYDKFFKWAIKTWEKGLLLKRKDRSKKHSKENSIFVKRGKNETNNS